LEPKTVAFFAENAVFDKNFLKQIIMGGNV
jgi:hypothetical protein